MIVASGLTVCVRLVEDAPKLPDPLYCAVIVVVPTGRPEVARLALPSPPTATGLPSGVLPRRNVTVPTVTGLPPLVMVAVNETD